jgi:hypothetical protein
MLDRLDIIQVNNGLFADLDNEDRTRYRRASVNARSLADEMEHQQIGTTEQVKSLRLAADDALSLDISLARDTSMTKNIQDYLKTNAEVIPIVFIGSFHTPGITKALGKSIDCIVLDAQGGDDTTEGERQQFQRLAGDFDNAFEDAFKGATTTPGFIGTTGFTDKQLLRISRGARSFANSFEARSAEVARNFGIEPDDAKVLTSLSDHLGYASHKKVEVGGAGSAGGGGGKKPPVDGAIGSFDFGREPNQPAMLAFLSNEKDRRAPNQLGLLGNVMARPPPPWWQPKAGLKSTRLNVDAAGHVTHAILYDGGANTAWLYDAATIDFTSLMALPKHRAEKNATIHFQRLSGDTRSNCEDKKHG